MKIIIFPMSDFVYSIGFSVKTAVFPERGGLFCFIGDQDASVWSLGRYPAEVHRFLPDEKYIFGAWINESRLVLGRSDGCVDLFQMEEDEGSEESTSSAFNASHFHLDHRITLPTGLICLSCTNDFLYAGLQSGEVIILDVADFCKHDILRIEKSVDTSILCLCGIFGGLAYLSSSGEAGFLDRSTEPFILSRKGIAISTDCRSDKLYVVENSGVISCFEQKADEILLSWKIQNEKLIGISVLHGDQLRSWSDSIVYSVSEKGRFSVNRHVSGVVGIGYDGEIVTSTGLLFFPGTIQDQGEHLYTRLKRSILQISDDAHHSQLSLTTSLPDEYCNDQWPIRVICRNSSKWLLLAGTLGFILKHELTWKFFTDKTDEAKVGTVICSSFLSTHVAIISESSEGSRMLNLWDLRKPLVFDFRKQIIDFDQAEELLSVKSYENGGLAVLTRNFADYAVNVFDDKFDKPILRILLGATRPQFWLPVLHSLHQTFLTLWTSDCKVFVNAIPAFTADKEICSLTEIKHNLLIDQLSSSETGALLHLTFGDSTSMIVSVDKLASVSKLLTWPGRDVHVPLLLRVIEQLSCNNDPSKPFSTIRKLLKSFTVDELEKRMTVVLSILIEETMKGLNKSSVESFEVVDLTSSESARPLICACLVMRSLCNISGIKPIINAIRQSDPTKIYKYASQLLTGRIDGLSDMLSKLNRTPAQLRMAASLLVVLQDSIGPECVRKEFAAPILKKALEFGLWDLVADLLRFFAITGSSIGEEILSRWTLKSSKDQHDRLVSICLEMVKDIGTQLTVTDEVLDNYSQSMCDGRSQSCYSLVKNRIKVLTEAREYACI